MTIKRFARPLAGLLAVAALAFGSLMIFGANQMTAEAKTKGKVHRIAFHLDDNDAARMNLVLNNVANVVAYYQSKSEDFEVEVVTYGPGLHMLRADTSPVKERVKAAAMSLPNVRFAACENTREGMKKTEGKEIELLAEARSVPSGVIRMVELQEKGWSYIRP